MKTASAQVGPFGINGRDELPLIRVYLGGHGSIANPDEQELISTVTAEC